MTDQRSSGKGQALTEFVLAFPIFALIVFGLLDVGRLVYINNAISQGAREGARVGSVAAYSDGCGLGRDACVVSAVQGRMAAVPGSTVTVSCTRQTGSGTIVIANADGCRANDFLVVRVDTPVSMFTPLIGQLVGTFNLRAEARVVVNS